MFDTLRQAERTRNIVAVLAKNGFDDLVGATGLEKYLKFTGAPPPERALRLSRSERIRKTVEELGSTFIKLAQVLSTRPDLIPLELANEFAKLQDQVAPVPFSQIRPRFYEAFGKEVEAIFDGDLVLIASASLGQVYRGRLKSGNDVAVKVLKPGVDATIRLDLKLFYRLAAILEDRLRIYGIDSPTRIVQEFEKTIVREFDYTAEALNLKRFARNFAGDRRIAVPKLYEAYSGTKILTMEFVEGIKVTDVGALKEAGIDAAAVAKNGFDLMAEQMFVHRFFHADPHPGNIFALADGRIAFVDFGMMGSISERDRGNFVDTVYYVVKEEEEKAALSLLKLAKVENSDLDTEGFAKDMGDVIRTYFYGALKEISIKNLLNDIITLMRRHRVYFRENNYLLAKALITIEGVGKALDPDFNASESIKPFILRFYRETFSFPAFLARMSEFPKEAGDFLLQFPPDIKAIIDKMKSGRFKIEFEHVGLEEFESSMEKSFNRLSLSIIIAAVLIGSALLLLAQTPPLLFNIPVLGLVGFLTAFAMGLVLIVSIFKKGRL